MRDWVDFESEILNCPYCGKEIGDAWEYGDDDEMIIECSNCEKEFEFSKESTALYTTYRKE